MKNILESVFLHACLAVTMLGASSSAMALDHRGIVSDKVPADGFVLISDSKPVSVCVDDRDDKGVKIAASNLSEDFGRVCGTRAPLSRSEEHTSELQSQR